LSEEEIGSRVKIVRGDVTDLSNLLRTIQENNVGNIIHEATLLTPEVRVNPPLAIRVNIEGTINVFEAARILGLKKVVWASTISVFGPAEKYLGGYVRNDAPHYPRSIYAATKSFNEVAATHYFNEYGVDITGIRYSFTYGVGHRRGLNPRIIRQVIYDPALGKPSRVENADSTMGWIYVDDSARATVLMSKVPNTKTRAYTIKGDIRSVREVADYVRQLLPDADITLLPGADINEKFNCDTSLIEEEIGYRPQWSLEQGVKETINITRQAHGLPPV
jgi:nucleoside-diphosphate-sugar epimerase